MNLLIVSLLGSFEFTGPEGGFSAVLTTTALVSVENSVFTNPAMLAQLPGYNLTFFHTNPYNIAGLNFNQIALNLKRPVNLGFGVAGFGTEGYEELTFSLGTAFPLAAGLFYGLALQGLSVAVVGYGTDLVPAFDFGLLCNKEKYTLGLAIDNLNQPRNQAGDELPAQLKLGMVFRPVENLKLGADLLKIKGYGERLRTGVELQLVPVFALRLGLGTNPVVVAGGVGGSYKCFRVDYTCRFHPRLKETHIIGLGICLR